MSSRSNTLVVERGPIDSLRAAEPPVRRHSKKQFKKLCRSLAKYGQVTPILVTPEREIIDLELVWRALKANGATHVDVIVIRDKSPAEIKALRLMLNRSAMDAVWDNENLRSVLQDLIDLDFDLELTGFDSPEIDHHLNLDLRRFHNLSMLKPSFGGTAFLIRPRGSLVQVCKGRRKAHS